MASRGQSDPAILAGGGCTGGCTDEFLPLGLAQGRTEVKDLIQHLFGLKVDLAAAQVHVPASRETPLHVEHNADAPESSGDQLVAAAAPGLPAGRLLGTIDTRDSGASALCSTWRGVS